MKQVMVMRMTKATLATLVLSTFTAVNPASAQSGPGLRIDIPYTFTFSAKPLPAGIYTFTLAGSRLNVASASIGQTTQSIISEISGPAELFREGSLVFDKTEAGLILSEVWIPGMEGLLMHSVPKGHARTVLSAPLLDQNRIYSGKAAFHLTCAKCHGADGKGSKEANKFFNTTIPPLTSAQVQSKSDAELRNQISRGSAKMPPVEVDEAGFRHLLPPKDVEAVIAYVRTLKQ
jgi:mono/diheme cytochrome c family protein